MTRSSEELPAPIPPPPGPPGRSLAKAVASAAVLLALVVLAYLAGRDALFALVDVVVSLALFELLSALRAHGRHPMIVFAQAVAVAVMTAAYAGRWTLLLGALAVLVSGGLALALRPGRGPTPASDAAWTIVSVAWIAGGGAAAAALLAIDPGGPRLLVSYLLVVASSDVAAYFVGSRLGRHRLAPHISPGKSWEGAAGGLLAALAAGAVAGVGLDQLTTLQGVGLGALCGLLGPVGDLVESLAKREIGLKDSGGLLPGHGGFLDRLDAMLFCAAPVFAYLRVLGL